VIRLAVGPDVVLDMLPNPLFRRSAITPEVASDIRGRELGVDDHGRRFRLTALRIRGQSLADLDVIVSTALTRLRVDGVFGLDFFERFAGVYGEPHTNLVVLSHVTRS